MIHGLSNRAIFNDLEGPQTQILSYNHALIDDAKSKSTHCVTNGMQNSVRK